MNPYDIFISYRSTNKPWVETLARNLKNLGYRVFLDFLELIPGQNFNQGIYNALQTSPKAILVASAEAVESGWVSEEYTAMFSRKQRDPEFTFVPVIFNNEFPQFPFLSNTQAVDFGKDEYHHAFYRLLCGLERVPPGGENIGCKIPLKLPPQMVKPTVSQLLGHRIFVEELLTHFDQDGRPLILLVQSDRQQTSFVNALLDQAKKRYLPDRCLHIALPYSTDAEVQECFAMLALQCGFREPIHRAMDFQFELTRLLSQDKPLFLLVSRFEHGTESIRKSLASTLRGLYETNAHRIHIMLCGGEKLAELKYFNDPQHSFLNIAEDKRLPELEPSDVYALRNACCNQLPLTEELANQFLSYSYSGGHPVLLQKCLQLYQQHPSFKRPDYLGELCKEPVIWQSFLPFTHHDSAERQQMQKWLNHHCIRPAEPFIRDSLLRRLYWKNLLGEKLGRNHQWLLCWRCEAIRLAGQKILAN
jgi:TIR domain